MRYATNMNKGEYIDILDVSKYYPNKKYQIFYARKGGSVNPVVGLARTKKDAIKIAERYKKIMNGGK